MKHLLTVCLLTLTLFLASCAHSSYPQSPAQEKETTQLRNVNNIFN